MPTDLDVLRARIRTLGVQEYNLVFETRSQSPSARVQHAVQAVMAAAVTHAVGDPLDERDAWKEWAVYDVGGARSQVCGSFIHSCFIPVSFWACVARWAEGRRVLECGPG